MHQPVSITAAYAFLPLTEDGLPKLREELLQFGKEQKMQGLVLIAPEGINATVCGTEEAIAAWKALLLSMKSDIVFKDSKADKKVFGRWIVKIKKEIVLLKRPDIRPEGAHRHISPAQWNAMLQEEDVVVIDARNSYEFAIGKFRGAIDCGTRTFNQFPDFVRSAMIPKEKKVLLYCTGGIRCEKAVFAMEQEGYRNVYQLEGGILAYLEQFPHAAFEGECFVFDERVSVDQDLRPSNVFQLCTGCGNPSDAEICGSCAAVPA